MVSPSKVARIYYICCLRSLHSLGVRTLVVTAMFCVSVANAQNPDDAKSTLESLISSLEESWGKNAVELKFKMTTESNWEKFFKNPFPMWPLGYAKGQLNREREVHGTFQFSPAKHVQYRVFFPFGKLSIFSSPTKSQAFESLFEPNLKREGNTALQPTGVINSDGGTFDLREFFWPAQLIELKLPLLIYEVSGPTPVKGTTNDFEMAVSTTTSTRRFRLNNRSGLKLVSVSAANHGESTINGNQTTTVTYENIKLQGVWIPKQVHFHRSISKGGFGFSDAEATVDFEITGTPKFVEDGANQLQWGLEMPKGTKVFNSRSKSSYVVGGEERNREVVQSLGESARDITEISKFARMAESKHNGTARWLIAMLVVSVLGGIAYLMIRSQTKKKPGRTTSLRQH